MRSPHDYACEIAQLTGGHCKYSTYDRKWYFTHHDPVFETELLADGDKIVEAIKEKLWHEAWLRYFEKIADYFETHMELFDDYVVLGNGIKLTMTNDKFCWCNAPVFFLDGKCLRHGEGGETIYHEQLYIQGVQ